MSSLPTMSQLAPGQSIHSGGGRRTAVATPSRTAEKHVLTQPETSSRQRKGISSATTLPVILLSFLGLGGILILLKQAFSSSGYRPAGEPARSHLPVGLPRIHVERASAPPGTTTTSPPRASPTAILEVFQVYQPVLIPNNNNSDGVSNPTVPTVGGTAANCQVLLMQHSFGQSYGVPFVGNYTPPSCKFNRVVMNFTVTSRGRQFDRLAIMYLGDTEVFRTSTAEPDQGGIRWEYMKDMSEYMYFWNSPQKIIFDLGNNVDSTYTGAYNTTLTATFFTSPETPEPAALIVPVSARNGASNAASVFMVPTVNATNTITLPRNINRAVFSVSACGQASEEFWWSNLFQSSILTFNATSGIANGFSAFREVQVFIDGQLAGVHWPFPIIFTGGVVPGLWSPLVGIDAFDLREHEIDITPWLPVLCDGESHTFEIRVAGVVDDGGTQGTLSEAVGASWYVTGKIFLWLDADADSITTGSAPTIVSPPPTLTLSQSHTQNATGANETLVNNIAVTRNISISASVKTQNGTQLSTWTQSLSYSNLGTVSDFGQVQLNVQATDGVDQSTGSTAYQSTYSYPLYANTSAIVLPDGNYTLSANIVRGLRLRIDGSPVHPTGAGAGGDFTFAAILTEGLSPVSSFPGSLLVTSQNGSATLFSSPTANVSASFGSTGQSLSFSGVDTRGGVGDRQLYSRDVLVVNGTTVADRQSVVGVPVINTSSDSSSDSDPSSFAVQNLKATIGRGPGDDGVSLVSFG